MRSTPMKRLAAALAVVALFLAGCSDDVADKHKVNDASESNSGRDEYHFDEVVINGMNCILVKSKTYGDYKVVAFDCDWDSKDNGGNGG